MLHSFGESAIRCSAAPKLRNSRWSATWDNQDSDFEPYWARVSFRLRALMRENFPDCGEWEYAATCLLRALRVFAASAVRDEHRMRLLIWISVLVARLRDLAAIPQS
jgi:hypothetical protein